MYRNGAALFVFINSKAEMRTIHRVCGDLQARARSEEKKQCADQKRNDSPSESDCFVCINVARE